MLDAMLLDGFEVNLDALASTILKFGLAMGAELARVRFFVAALKSGDTS